MLRRAWLVLLAAVIAITMLAGCASPSGGPSGTTGTKPTDAGSGILRNSTATGASIINPHEAGTTYDKAILGYTQALLYDLFPDSTGTNAVLQGELADGEPKQMDKDGKVWQIKLKANAKWANGNPLTADDLVYSWQMLLDPKLANQYGGTFANNFIKIVNATEYFKQGSTGKPVDWTDVGIKKIDNLTVEITTAAKNTAWEVMNHFTLVASSPVYKPLYEQYMNADRTSTLYGTDKDKYMGCGAFILTDWVKGSLQKYAKNPNYVYKDMIWLAGIETQVIKDGGTALQMFESGNLDYVGLTSSDIEKYAEDPRVHIEPSLTVRHIEINMADPEKPILGNLNFRKALYYAIDRTKYAQVTSMKPAPYVMSSRKIADLANGTPFRDLDVAKSYLPANNGYDPKLAKELFDKALQETGATKVDLTLNYYETRPETRVISELMQKDLAAVFGADKFSLSLKQLPNTQLFDTMRSFPSNPKSYEISWAGWGHSAAEFSPWKSFLVYTSTYDRKNAPIYDPKLDDLYAQVSSEEARFDQKKTIDLTAQLEKYVLDNVYEIPVYEAVNWTLISDRVQLQTQRWMSGVGFGFKYAKVAQTTK